MTQFPSSRRTFIQSALLTGTATAAATLTSTPIARTQTPNSPNRFKEGVFAQTNSDIVETVYGKVRGSERNGIKIFRGIPYGADTGREEPLSACQAA